MDKKEIKRFTRLLQELQKIDAEFPLQYAVCLAEIALDEGLSVSELAHKTNLALSTVSRIVGALSTARQKGTPYGLVKVAISARERRRKEITLTPKGQATIDSVSDIMSTKSASGLEKPQTVSN